MRINPLAFVALVFGVVSTALGESLKTLVIANFPENNDIEYFLRHLGEDVKSSDVILIQNPLDINSLKKEIKSHQGEFDTAIVHTHGNTEKIPTMFLTNESIPITEVIKTVNHGNEENLKKIHLSSCYIGANFEKIANQDVSNPYHQELQESLIDGQTLFLHGDNNTGIIASSFGARFKKIIENKAYSISEAITDSGEALLVVAKHHGNLRGGSHFKTFEPDIFGRHGEKFSSEELLSYLDKISKAAKDFEHSHNLPSAPALNAEELNRFLELRFLSDVQKYINQNNTEAVRTLLDNGANPNARDKDGRSFLFYTDLQNYVAFAKLFIEKGADVNLKNHDGLTALEIAVHMENEEATEFLLKQNKTNRNIQDRQGRSLLMLAIAQDSSDKLAKLLIENGVDLNQQDPYGGTALMNAVSKNNVKLVKLLIEKGADVTLRRTDTFSALDLANLPGKEKEIIELLTQEIERRKKQEEESIRKVERTSLRGGSEDTPPPTVTEVVSIFSVVALLSFVEKILGKKINKKTTEKNQ